MCVSVPEIIRFFYLFFYLNVKLVVCTVNVIHLFNALFSRGHLNVIDSSATNNYFQTFNV